MIRKVNDNGWPLRNSNRQVLVGESVELLYFVFIFYFLFDWKIYKKVRFLVLMSLISKRRLKFQFELTFK